MWKRKSPASAAKKKRKGRGEATKHQAKGVGQISIRNGRIVMLLPRRLRSYNRRGGHWSEYRDRKAWQQVLTESIRSADDGTFTLPTKKRMRLELLRLAPSKRYLLDKENLEVSGKRLVDTLVEYGYLVDDERRWCDGPWVTQGVSDDNCYWTIVTLSQAPAYDETGDMVICPQDEVKKKLQGSVLQTGRLECPHEHSLFRWDRRRRSVVRSRARGQLTAAQTEGRTAVHARPDRRHSGRSQNRICPK